MLDHLGHYLWVELGRAVAWHLHDLGSDLLAVSLPGAQMMRQLPGVLSSQEPQYLPNHFEAGGALATDPTPVFAFAAAKGLVQPTRDATVDAICRWVQDNLVHYATETPRDHAASWDWNQPTPPLLTMLERRLDPLKDDPVPRYQAWRGCHGASSVMTFLARVLNVPARGSKAWIGGPHGAIDFPEQRQFCPHCDDFYAIPALKDPAVPPGSVFGTPSNYDGDKALWSSQPADRDARTAEYTRWIYIRAQGVPTFWLLDAYWHELIHGSIVLAHQLRTLGLSDSEVTATLVQLEPRLQAIIDGFMQQPENAGKSLAEGLVAYRAPIDAWNAARGTT